MLRDGSFSMTVSRRAEVDDLDDADTRRRLTEVKDRILTFAKGKQWEGMLRNFAAHWDNLWSVMAAMSPWLNVSPEERYALLVEDSLSARFDAVERLLLEGLELIDVQAAAQSAQQEKPAATVPEEPETMAPAWPMVLPSGAVKPAT